MEKLAQLMLQQVEVWHAPALQPEAAEELTRRVSALCESLLAFADVAPFEVEPADFTKVLLSSKTKAETSQSVLNSPRLARGFLGNPHQIDARLLII